VEEAGPSPLVILATRLRYIERIPFMGINGSVDEFHYFNAATDPIVDAAFESANDEVPYASGNAFCMSCDYNWAAVAPVGTVWLECPSCKAEKGRFKFPMALPEKTLVYTCNCGNQLFNMTPEGHFCPNCGEWRRF
jgi:rubrerythrin